MDISETNLFVAYNFTPTTLEKIMPVEESAGDPT